MPAAVFAPIFVVILMVFPTVAEAQHPNFTGNWKLVPQASNFATAVPPKAMTMSINHRDPALMVRSVTTTAQGEQVSEYRWWTDGYPSANTIRSIDYKTLVNWERATLVSKSKATTAQGPIEMTDNWTLTEGGKRLSIYRILRVGDRQVEQTYSYDRQ